MLLAGLIDDLLCTTYTVNWALRLRRSEFAGAMVTGTNWADHEEPQLEEEGLQKKDHEQQTNN